MGGGGVFIGGNFPRGQISGGEFSQGGAFIGGNFLGGAIFLIPDIRTKLNVLKNVLLRVEKEV